MGKLAARLRDICPEVLFYVYFWLLHLLKYSRIFLSMINKKMYNEFLAYFFSVLTHTLLSDRKSSLFVEKSHSDNLKFSLLRDRRWKIGQLNKKPKAVVVHVVVVVIVVVVSDQYCYTF